MAAVLGGGRRFSVPSRSARLPAVHTWRWVAFRLGSVSLGAFRPHLAIRFLWAPPDTILIFRAERRHYVHFRLHVFGLLKFMFQAYKLYLGCSSHLPGRGGNKSFNLRCWLVDIDREP